MAQQTTDPRAPRRDGLSASEPPARPADAAGNAIDSSKLQPAAPAATAPSRTAPSGEEDRAARIAKAAYEKAQQRGFEPGYEWDDWFSAEREIDAEIQALMSRSSLPGS